jgi:hypothetical protein
MESNILHSLSMVALGAGSVYLYSMLDILHRWIHAYFEAKIRNYYSENNANNTAHNEAKD